MDNVVEVILGVWLGVIGASGVFVLAVLFVLAMVTGLWLFRLGGEVFR